MYKNYYSQQAGKPVTEKTEISVWKAKEEYPGLAGTCQTNPYKMNKIAY